MSLSDPKFAFLAVLVTAVRLVAAPAVKVNFTLHTTDVYGAPLDQQRYYYVYRPASVPKTTPAPMVLIFESSLNAGPATFFQRKADQAGFLVVSCSFSGNSNVVATWVNDDPRIVGPEDYDYTSEVIQRVRALENGTDAFIVGHSKGGHMSMAYACERQSMIKAAASVESTMSQIHNIPSAPVPIMLFQGTLDASAGYTTIRDTADTWRAIDGLLAAAPTTTYEGSPLDPGQVSQTTWRGGINGTQVALVSIIGGTHTYAKPTIQTGYDATDGLWAFFSQFLTPTQAAPRIVSQPVDNIQYAGRPATFWVTASSTGAMSYQWQKDGINIPGATENWYTLPAADPSDNGATFRAIASNDAGSATSSAATLMVRSAPAGPTISTQPDDLSVVAGQPASFSVSIGDETPARYQWMQNGVEIPGATTNHLRVPVTVNWDSGSAYTAALTTAAGTTISRRAILTVLPAPGAPIILVHPVRVRVLPGGSATFSVSAWSVTPMRYQWQKGKVAGLMADVPGATDSAYTFSRAKLSDSGTLIRCIVSNDAGSTVTDSDVLPVTAAPKRPDVTSPLTAVAKTGAPFTYTTASTGGTVPLTFSAVSLPQGLAVDSVRGVISGIPTMAGVYKITIGSANPAGVAHATLTLTVTDTPPPLTIEAWRTACFGASAINPAIAGDDADPDGDGATNRQEFLAGTNPLDPLSRP